MPKKQTPTVRLRTMGSHGKVTRRFITTSPFNFPPGAVAVAQQAVSSSPQLYPAATTTVTVSAPTAPLAATSTVTTSTSQLRNIVSVQNNAAATGQGKTVILNCILNTISNQLNHQIIELIEFLYAFP